MQGRDSEKKRYYISNNVHFVIYSPSHLTRVPGNLSDPFGSLVLLSAANLGS